jgi:O-antigen/teichoic acid export membrane protein
VISCIIGETLNEYKLFVQRIGLVGITNVLIAISSLILLPIVTKSFSINDYGIWVIIITTLSLVPNLANLGLPYTMVRFLSSEKDREKIREDFYSIAFIVFISSCIVTALLFLLSSYVGAVLLNGDINLAKLLSIIIFVACLNAFLLNYFRTFQQMRRYSIILLIQTYLGIFIVAYFAINGYGLYYATIGLLVANVVTFIVMVVFILSNIGFKVPKFRNMREFLSFGLPTIPANLSSWIVDSSDRYVIGIFLGTAFVGYYSPGYTLGNIIIMVLAPFSILLPSVLPKYYDDNNIDKVRTFIKYSIKYFLLIAIPAAFGLSILSKNILMVLTTPDIALNGYLVTPFVALSAVLFGFYAIAGNVLILEKRTRIMGATWVIAAVLNLVLNIIFVPFLGIIGAALITLVAYLVAFIITLKYSIKYFKFDFDLVLILKSVTASVFMSGMLLLINPNGILNIFIAVIIGIMVYFVILFILKGLNKDEFKFIRELLK